MATQEEMSRYFWSASTNCPPVSNRPFQGLFRHIAGDAKHWGERAAKPWLPHIPRADGAKRRASVLIPPGYLHPGKGKH